MNKQLKLPINSLSGVGKKRSMLYNKLGIFDVQGLLYYFPRTYIDCTNPLNLSQTNLYEKCCVKAVITKKGNPIIRQRKMSIYTASAIDCNEQPLKIIFFNNPYALKDLIVGKEYLFFGKIGGNMLLKEMIAPQIINLDSAGLIPQYPLTAGLTSKMIISNVKYALTLLNDEDSLPKNLIEKYNLISLKEALNDIHFPKTNDQLKKARDRLIFEELLCWQIGLCLIRSGRADRTKEQLTNTDLSPLLKSLPFELTKSQIDVINECIADCLRSTPMNRLVQGDVGCGKTMVATALSYLFAKSFMQSAMMAPTDILARQHFETFKKTLEPLGVRIGLLVGSMSNKEKQEIKKQLADGQIDIILGTHSLFQDKTIFSHLGLVITDEQHRFGVEQRKKLTKKGAHPHMLVMSATPIPRTLALIVYGDLNISNINELPLGRKPVKTVCIPSFKRGRAFSYIKQQLDEGHQVYIVCPAIEQYDQEIASVSSYVEKLEKTKLKNYSIAMLHGKMSSEEKDELMQKFGCGKIDLLVTTTVIEVGVDVPNATVIMIENAELFGLSQLHQLRGRIGRGSFDSLCILVSDLKTFENKERLKTICNTNNGFEIAEKDLEIRGPGDFFGDKQHGMPNFKIANLISDNKILKICKQNAEEIIKHDHTLENDKYKYLKQNVKQMFMSNQSVL